MSTRAWPLLPLLFALVACAASGGPDASEHSPATPGEALYKSNCVMCHGRDGGLRMSGAKDLRQSTLSKAEMVAIVTQGKGGMAGFGRTLSKEQIEQVVEHVRALHAAP